jgi:hypothetical protein
MIEPSVTETNTSRMATLWDRLESTGRTTRTATGFGFFAAVAGLLGRSGWLALVGGFTGALACLFMPLDNKRTNSRTWIPSAVLSALGVMLIVTPAADNSISSLMEPPLPQPKGCGEWPEYAGDWESITSAMGAGNPTMAYLRVQVASNGSFTGTYESYRQSGSVSLPVNIYGNTSEFPVYDPAGDRKEIVGCMDFGASTGSTTLRGLGKSTFQIKTSTDSAKGAKEIVLTFPSGFHFSASKIQRHSA